MTSARFSTLLQRLVLAVLAAQLTTSPVDAEPPTTARPASVSVMSWNIRYDNPRDGENAWQHRKDWAAKIITDREVDIAGLQEVLHGQLADLKDRMPDMAVYGVGRDDGKTRGEYAPILYRQSRFELLDKATFWLSRTPNQIGSRDWDAAITRIASWVKLRDRHTGHVFYVINTHFDHRGSEARAESASLLVSQLRTTFGDHPVVLTGDFNATPTSRPYKTLVGESTTSERFFRDALRVSAQEPKGPDSTWNGFKAIAPNRRIDFVFVTDSVRVLQHQILTDQRDGRFPSDHLPVLTTLQLRRQ